ncbi:hypothetical protein [Phaeacidiphilus oryzae]|uniref:hypothetical protein n=1 Tax=Phaeacidiphilus oryzae TaxID=348818 RepID=UPI000A49C77D|nr:hypothetical protein [Phaeacidiphilus oryzae]
MSAIKKAVGVVADAVRTARGEQTEIHVGTARSVRTVTSRRAPVPAPTDDGPEEQR